MRIPVTKTVTSVVPNGELEINFNGKQYEVVYHNVLFKGSPFVCPVRFSSAYTVDQIAKDRDVVKFISRFE